MNRFELPTREEIKELGQELKDYGGEITDTVMEGLLRSAITWRLGPRGYTALKDAGLKSYEIKRGKMNITMQKDDASLEPVETIFKSYGIGTENDGAPDGKEEINKK